MPCTVEAHTSASCAVALQVVEPTAEEIEAAIRPPTAEGNLLDNIFTEINYYPGCMPAMLCCTRTEPGCSYLGFVLSFLRCTGHQSLLCRVACLYCVTLPPTNNIALHCLPLA